MFRLRRYRIFLLIAALATAAVYHISVYQWQVPNLQSLKSFQFKTEAIKTALPAPHAIIPTSIAVPNAIIPTASPEPPNAAVSTSTSSRISSTSIAPDERPTVSGDEFLKKQPTPDEEFGLWGEGRVEVPLRPAGVPMTHWKPPKAHFPVPPNELKKLPTGMPKTLPQIQYQFSKEPSAKKKDRLQKQATILEAFKNAWSGYKTYAWGHDELAPLTNSSKDTFNGWGATLVDTLDTLWIMGLKTEFGEAVAKVQEIDFTTSPRKDIPVFETTIRYLGGLIAAYDLSQNSTILDKAVELADILMGTFDTPNRMPQGYYHWAPSYNTQPHRSDVHMVMAELGSLSMEFTRLAQITKENKYYDAVARVTDALEDWQQRTSLPGLWPLRLDASGCKKVERPWAEAEKSPAEELLSVTGSKSDEKAAGAADEQTAAVSTDEEPRKLRHKRQVDDAPSEELPTNLDTDTGLSGALKDNVQAPGANESTVPLGEVFDANAILDVECEAQGLAHEPHAKVHTYSIGSMADSTYEYFPKMHALLGGLNTQYSAMYRDVLNVVRKEMLYTPMIPDDRDLLFAADIEISARTKEREIHYAGSHLACFAGGMFALGSKMFNLPEDLELAKKLTDGCVWAYESMPAGIMAETFELLPCEGLGQCSWNKTAWHAALDPHEKDRFTAVDKWNRNQEALMKVSSDILDQEYSAGTDETPTTHKNSARQVESEEPTRTLNAVLDDEEKPPSQGGLVPKVALSHDKYVAARILEERLPPGYTKINTKYYGLRPEAIESVFIMYRLTGDEYWREKGWDMFNTVQTRTVTKYGNAVLADVTSVINKQEDIMESFWLAETLKYYYLLFSEPGVISLDDYVL